jgi:hypothetical protein
MSRILEWGNRKAFNRFSVPMNEVGITPFVRSIEEQEYVIFPVSDATEFREMLREYCKLHEYHFLWANNAKFKVKIWNGGLSELITFEFFTMFDQNYVMLGPKLESGQHVVYNEQDTALLRSALYAVV